MIYRRDERVKCAGAGISKLYTYIKRGLTLKSMKVTSGWYTRTDEFEDSQDVSIASVEDFLPLKITLIMYAVCQLKHLSSAHSMFL